jgi:hypothetical protein
MKRTALIAVLLGAAPAIVDAQAGGESDRRARICVAGLHEPSTEAKGLGNPSGGNPEPDYTVEFNREKAIKVPRLDRGDGPASFVYLDQSKRHLIAIKHKGRQVESFRFDFPADEPNQCLFLNELYQTWQVWPAKRNRSCKCA